MKYLQMDAFWWTCASSTAVTQLSVTWFVKCHWCVFNNVTQ